MFDPFDTACYRLEQRNFQLVPQRTPEIPSSRPILGLLPWISWLFFALQLPISFILPSAKLFLCWKIPKAGPQVCQLICISASLAASYALACCHSLLHLLGLIPCWFMLQSMKIYELCGLSTCPVEESFHQVDALLINATVNENLWAL